jgi:hypothetical protein
MFQHFLDWLQYWGPVTEHDAPDQRRELTNGDMQDHNDQDPNDNIHLQYGPISPSQHDESDFAGILIDLYIFATTYNVPQLLTDTTDRMLWFGDNAPRGIYCSRADIARAYARTTRDSPLRKLLVVGCRLNVLEDGYYDELVQFPREYMADKLIEVELRGQAGRGSEYHAWYDLCKHHGHPRAEGLHDCPSRIPDLCDHDLSRTFVSYIFPSQRV